MEFKGTPAPWMVAKGDLNKTGESIVISPRNQIKYKHGWRVVCDISDLENFDKEDHANALLISKAPEMLEALKIGRQAIMELMNHEEGWEEEYTIIDELIKSATQI